MKIGQHLAKLEAKIEWFLFSDTVYIQSSGRKPGDSAGVGDVQFLNTKPVTPLGFQACSLAFGMRTQMVGRGSVTVGVRAELYGGESLRADDDAAVRAARLRRTWLNGEDGGIRRLYPSTSWRYPTRRPIERPTDRQNADCSSQHVSRPVNGNRFFRRLSVVVRRAAPPTPFARQSSRYLNAVVMNYALFAVDSTPDAQTTHLIYIHFIRK